MILHTIIDENDIFRQGDNEMPTQFIDIKGGQLEYRFYNEKKQVVRLHSTNPYDYLKSEYQPYSIFN